MDKLGGKVVQQKELFLKNQWKHEQKYTVLLGELFIYVFVKLSCFFLNLFFHVNNNRYSLEKR